MEAISAIVIAFATLALCTLLAVALGAAWRVGGRFAQWWFGE